MQMSHQDDRGWIVNNLQAPNVQNIIANALCTWPIVMPVQVSITPSPRIHSSSLASTICLGFRRIEIVLLVSL